MIFLPLRGEAAKTAFLPAKGSPEGYRAPHCDFPLFSNRADRHHMKEQVEGEALDLLHGRSLLHDQRIS
ncbi:MAG: hypothetical protein ACP5SH_10395 [Syntrophobacteraceae bacterium]